MLAKILDVFSILITKKEITGRVSAVDIAAKPETFVIRKVITHTKLASPQGQMR